jgi:hypothetical protein
LITVRDEPCGRLAEETGEEQIDIAAILTIAIAN